MFDTIGTLLSIERFGMARGWWPVSSTVPVMPITKLEHSVTAAFTLASYRGDAMPELASCQLG
jgi:hypothetical protein